jgi:UDP-N-acetylmuramoyl-tripeptide--D-alanyl-D-alanine ligase
MPIRNFLIRIVADGIYLLRFKTLRAGNTRFLAFTGTSGKTLARTAATYALRQAGFRIISPPYGYTNELGIVLAGLGIESLRLFSLRGIWQVVTSRPMNGSYACIEIGADWRRDIAWFLRRFKPYGVCITNVSAEEWTRPLGDIWKDKGALISHVPLEGFAVWSAQNESLPNIQEAIANQKNIRTFQFQCGVSASPRATNFTYRNASDEYSFSSPLVGMAPYAEAFGFAVSCIRAIDPNYQFSEDFFSAYRPPLGRLAQISMVSGATLISDTYKAVPQCMKYVLNFALHVPAKKRIAVVSAMHPLWMNAKAHYKELAGMLAQFDAVYFVGPSWTGNPIKSYAPQIIIVKRASTYARLAETLAQEAGPETVLVIKGAGRYHLERLVSRLAFRAL